MNGHDETERMAALYADGMREPAQSVPHNADAERSVLAAMMHDNNAVTMVQDWLREDDFFVSTHRAIYAAVLALTSASKQADTVTVAEWLESSAGDHARENANVAYDIGLKAFTSANVVAYAEIVAERSRLRQVLEIGQQLVAAALSPEGSAAAELAARSASELAQIAPARTSGLMPYREHVKEFYEELRSRHQDGKSIGLPTPWSELNTAIGGLRDGEVTVIAARSNMGKSLMGFSIARMTGLRGDPVAVFSMEMNGSDVVARDVAAMGDVPLQWLMGQDDGDSEIHWSRTTEAIKNLLPASILLDADPQLSAQQIIARAKRAHRQKPLRLVVVDHIHEMALPGKQGEVIERGQAMRDLKGLAKALRCPLVVLAQLNREAAATGDKRDYQGRPQIRHIRGAGGIEEVADVILFVHRPDVYNPADRPGLIEVIVGKGRNVKTGAVVNLRNRFEYQRAEDWSGQAPEPFKDTPAPQPASRGLGAVPGKWKPKNTSGHNRGGWDD